MFERFTDQARRVVVIAQEDALRRCADRIGTEHLLMGLSAVPEGLASDLLHSFGVRRSVLDAAIDSAYEPDGKSVNPDAGALASIGIDLDEVRRHAEEAFGPGALNRAGRRGNPRWGHIAFSRRAKLALEASLRQSRWLRHNHIGTEHVLLGVLAVEDGVAARLLREHGMVFEEVRDAVCARGGQTG